MPLSAEQQQLVLARLNANWPVPRRCHACQKDGPWDFNLLTELREYNEGTLVAGGPIVPLVSVACGHCGATILFNAIKLGIVDATTGKINAR